MILTTKKQSLIDLHILNIFFIIAIKPTWSLWVIFLIWYWNKFVLFYWECLFLHSLRRLVCYFLFVWCFLSALVLVKYWLCIKEFQRFPFFSIFRKREKKQKLVLISESQTYQLSALPSSCIYSSRGLKKNYRVWYVKSMFKIDF